MVKEYKETAHDYRIMYEGCLVRLIDPPANTAPIAQILNIQSDGDPHGVAPTGFTVKQYVKEEVELGVTTREKSAKLPLAGVDLTLPPFGFVNTGRSVFRVFCKKPSGNNKYRKLPVLQDISIDNPVRAVHNHLKLNPMEELIDYNMLNFWNTFEYTQPQDAIQGLFDGEFIGRAISSKFCFCITTKSPHVYLMYDQYVAGVVREPGTPVILEEWAVRFKDELETYGLEVA